MAERVGGLAGYHQSSQKVECIVADNHRKDGGQPEPGYAFVDVSDHRKVEQMLRLNQE